MLRLTPDFSGDGFYLYDDPVADMGGGLVMILVASFAITLPLMAVLQNPLDFAPAFFCFTFGFSILFLLGDALTFLAPLAFPFFVYGLASSATAMMVNSEGSAGLFMMCIIVLYLIGGGVALYGPFFDDFDNAALPTVLLGVPTFVAAMSRWMDEDGAPWFEIVMRVVWIATAVWMLVSLVLWIREVVKGRFPWRPLATVLCTAAAGIVPFVALGLAASRTAGDYLSFLMALVFFVVYLACGFVCARVAKLVPWFQEDRSLSVVWPLLLSLVAYAWMFASRTEPLLASVFVGDVIAAAPDIPLVRGLFEGASGLANVFGRCLEELLSLGARAVRGVLDVPIPTRVPVAPLFAQLFAILIVSLGVKSGDALANKLAGKAR